MISQPSSQAKPKIVLLWQTYYLSSHHIAAWVDCQSRGIDCLFIMNNENGVYDRIKSSSALPIGCKESIVPFDHNSYLDLGLPLFPYPNRQLRMVNYYNADYGFYLAHSQFSATDQNTFFIKVDHDIFLYGLTWPDLFDVLPINLGCSVTLRRDLSRGSSSWYWHPSSESVYGQHYSFGLFGFQGVSAHLIPHLIQRRQEIFARSKYYREDLTCPDVKFACNLDTPICEAFFETELMNIGVNPIEMFNLFPHLKLGYSLESKGGMASVDIPKLLADHPGAPFWLFHPWKPLPA